MSDQTTQDQENTKQSSTRAANTPLASENVTIRRPRPGTIVILAPHNTALMHLRTDDYVKVVLRLGMGE